MKDRYESKPSPALPPIVLNASEGRRLSMLVNSSAQLFPRAAHFLAREIDRASVVPDGSELRNVVRMGREVTHRDEETGEVRNCFIRMRRASPKGGSPSFRSAPL